MGGADDEGLFESINAITLATADMATAVSFYRGLGFRELYGGPDAAFTSFSVGADHLNLQLDRAHRPIEPVWGRVILYVRDVDEVYERALDAGLSPQMAPSDADWGERYFHLRDPDGHELSFARPLGPTAQEG